VGAQAGAGNGAQALAIVVFDDEPANAVGPSQQLDPALGAQVRADRELVDRRHQDGPGVMFGQLVDDEPVPVDRKRDRLHAAAGERVAQWYPPGILDPDPEDASFATPSGP
jgi:hypothetical protein